jgi:hypothetical protein
MGGRVDEMTFEFSCFGKPREIPKPAPKSYGELKKVVD